MPLVEHEGRDGDEGEEVEDAGDERRLPQRRHRDAIRCGRSFPGGGNVRDGHVHLLELVRGLTSVRAYRSSRPRLTCSQGRGGCGERTSPHVVTRWVNSRKVRPGGCDPRQQVEFLGPAHGRPAAVHAEPVRNSQPGGLPDSWTRRWRREPGCRRSGQPAGLVVRPVRVSSCVGSRTMSAAEALAVISSTVSAPTMTDATAGRESSQASETWYGRRPHSWLSRSTSRPISTSVSVNPAPPNRWSPRMSRCWTCSAGQ